MNPNDPSERARAIIARVAQRDLETVRPESHLLVDLEIDSPKAIDLLIELETELDIVIRDEDAAAMETVRDVLDFVARGGFRPSSQAPPA